MEITWLTAFIDRNESTFDDSLRFWEAATATEASPPRGQLGEFVTLQPSQGHAHLRAQRTTDGSNGTHLDLHVTDPESAVEEAVALGASPPNTGTLGVRSPGGLTMCFVADEGHRDVTPPDVLDPPCVVDQVCVDIPADLFETEITFWEALTGWPLHRSPLAEFAYLERQPQLPLRLLLQRLGADDAGLGVRAHLDLSTGDERERVTARHEGLGATTHFTGRYWTTLTDPSGTEYCLTMRDPATGSPPG